MTASCKKREQPYKVITAGGQQRIYLYIVATLTGHERQISEDLLSMDDWPHVLIESGDENHTWELLFPEEIMKTPVQMIPFDHGGHANILCIRREKKSPETFNVEVYDPYGPTYRWDVEDPQRTYNMKTALTQELKKWGTLREITYPEGVHPQQVQIKASQAAAYVQFFSPSLYDSMNDEWADDGFEWVENLCMFWSTLVVFIWYKTCKKLSLNTIGQTLASALQSAPDLDIDTFILTFADYLTRIGLDIRKNTPKDDEQTQPHIVRNAIQKIGKEISKPIIVRVIQDIKKCDCRTTESARSELDKCVETVIKEYSTTMGGGNC